jgi:hypothetical protein
MNYPRQCLFGQIIHKEKLGHALSLNAVVTSVAFTNLTCLFTYPQGPPLHHCPILTGFLISHNPNIRQEMEMWLILCHFPYSHTDILVANGYMANGQRTP